MRSVAVDESCALALHDFLQHAPTSYHYYSSDEDQPRKRQRVEEHDEHRRLPGAPSFVTLSSIKLLLTSTSSGTLRESIDVPTQREKLEVSLSDIVRVGSDRVNFTITPAASGKTKKSTISVPSDTFEYEKIVDTFELIRGAPKSSECFHLSALLYHIPHLPPSSNAFVLEIRLAWKTGVSAATFRSSKRALPILEHYLPIDYPRVHSGPFTAQDFYDSVHVPPRTTETPASIQSPHLTSQLYPFQARAMVWLLEKEGVRLRHDGQIVPCAAGTSASEHFNTTTDADGQKCYVSHLTGHVSLDEPQTPQLRGGILSEEMGLGKTLELIDLILIHPRPKDMNDSSNLDESGTVVQQSAATLIITPSTILRQWQAELEMHAPTLRVMVYDGAKQSDEKDDEDLKTKLSAQDVVLTTYGVLANEIHYAEEKRDRGLRQAKKYTPRRSPLVDICWWRVCLDEAQMIQTGVSNAAKVAQLIPRVNAWAVSGTPLRNDVTDLYGLLIFLRYDPFCNIDVWKRTTRDELCQLFGRIALRHTKSKLRDELKLPEQRRLVLSMAFSATEEQNYSDLFQQMCHDCGLNSEGGPLYETWDPTSPETIEKMRSWLSRLRQTCLHAEIGARNRRALGNRDGPLRTIDEVLDVMISQNETLLRAAERNCLLSKVTRGQIHSFGKDVKNALRLFLEALEDANVAVDECRKELEEELDRVQRSKIDSEGKDASGRDEESEVDENDEEAKGREQLCRQRLRTALEIQHICLFFAATGHYQVKEDASITEPDSDEYRRLEAEESSLYDRAKVVRRELLSDVSKKTERIIQSVKSRQFAKLGTVERMPNHGGIESRRLADEIEKMRYFLNAQSEQYEDWRKKLVEQITARLLDADEELEMTGEEYEASTKLQDESYALLEACRFSIADRHCMVTGQVNILINYEMKQALQHASETVEERGPAPELMRAILHRRGEINPPENIKSYGPRENVKTISLRGVLAQLRSALTVVQWNEGQRSNRATAEAAILEDAMQHMQSMSTTQMKNLAAAEKDVDLLRSAINQRLEYYRQMQHVSDTVKPLEEETRDSVDEDRASREQVKEARYNETLARHKTKRRFLNHLKLESSEKEEQRICIICRDSFENGILTVCGHQFCAECIKYWWSSHGNCPMCKRQLKSSDFHNITYKPRQLEAKAETSIPSSQEGSPSAFNAPSSIYTDISEHTLNEIKTIDLPGASFGSKIDTMVRHILWLRSSDPGAKTIIFSQYRDFLDVIGRAFRSSKVGFSEMSSKSGNGIQRFREDASVECFLLHAKADSSGLNLVNATHVILAEPLINAAIELQAIARVHRIGQRRPTTVWMYIVKDTVEEAIYEISVARRLEHIHQRQKSNEASRAATPGPLEESALDAANTLELQAANTAKLFSKGQSGGEIVGSDDLWRCLFGKAEQQQGKTNLLGGDASDAGAQEVGRFLRAEAAGSRQENAQQMLPLRSEAREFVESLMRPT